MDRAMSEAIEQGLADGSYLRLLPGHPVYLFAPDGGGERFVRLFRETWRRLPHRERRRFLGYWKGGDRHRPGPAIELFAGPAGRTPGEGPGGTRVAVGEDGPLLGFRGDLVDAHPDGLVMDLIAHGLARIYGHLKGWNEGEDDPSREEGHARGLAVYWGFSHEVMAARDRGHGVGVPDPAGMAEGPRAPRIGMRRDSYPGDRR